MSRPTSRVLALLAILQAGGTRTVDELARSLDVDERTVRRYIDHLVELDIPVRSLRGRYGGYRLEPGYRMPPLMLTNDEALAVLLGLVAGRRAGLVTTSIEAAESAAAKLHRVLPELVSRKLDALLEITDFTLRPTPVVSPETEVLLLLAEATQQHRPVRIGYRAADGAASERTLNPYRIVAHSGRWYVTGDDSVSRGTRTFRLDRITTTEMLDNTFDSPSEFDAAEHLLSGLANAPHQHAVSLRVQGTADEVRLQFPPGLVAVEDDADLDGFVRVRLQAERLDWVPALLAGLDRSFVIEQPDALRELVQSLAQRLINSARHTSSGPPASGPRGSSPTPLGRPTDHRESDPAR